ncbi:MAG: thiamine ABC transporter substrate-binding protein [Anaerolineaceae bacterium]|nr:thiamine ABC transporter substrate-binding protein [Anaerolineaceae bacterium]
MKKKKILITLIVGILLASACKGEPASLVVLTHDSFAVSEEVITKFEKENRVDVIFLPSGDAGSALNRAILSKESNIADVLYGIDNTFLSRALDEDLFDAYAPDVLVKIPDEFKLDPESRVVPIDYGDVCINYDKNYFTENELAIPESLEDLTAPEYAGLLVVENPAVSSPGLAFMLATLAEYGEKGYLEYWQRLKNNGVVVANDWESAYYSHFSGSAGQGAQPMVVSYGTSPAAEVIFAEEALDEAPTASLVGENMCFRQIEFAGILKGTKNRVLAEKFIDYMLSKQFQEDIPMNMFVFPVNPNAEIPQEFLDYVQVPERTAHIEPENISNNREKWVEAWRELMLR